MGGNIKAENLLIFILYSGKYKILVKSVSCVFMKMWQDLTDNNKVSF